MTQPFLSFYTPTYKRPVALAACMASVAAQTAVQHVEQLVVPDYVGLGIDGMYARVPDYAGGLHGQYVHFLADDDVLASPTVVAEVMAVVDAFKEPDVLIVGALKAGLYVPPSDLREPVQGSIDLGCLIVKADAWHRHCHQYGRRYEGDYDFAKALHAQGERYRWVWRPELHFLTGAASHGRAEGQWP